MKRIISIMAGLMLLLSLSPAVNAADSTGFAYRWDVIKYQTPDKDARIKAYEELIADAKAAAMKEPDNPDNKVWAALSLATLAGDVGAMGGALGKVTEAKELLEAALAQNPGDDMKAYIHTTLGSLYYQVPGWPLGFGDEGKAVEHLNKGLEINPTGLDMNFWMASYLWDETDRYEEAGKYFAKALAAPPIPGREISDKGRKQEAAKLLAEVEKKLGYKIPVPEPVVAEPAAAEPVAEAAVEPVAAPAQDETDAAEVAMSEAPAAPATAVTEVAETPVATMLTVAVNVGNIRSAPSISSAIIAKLHRGDVVTKQGEQGEWYQVILNNGTTAWAHRSIF